MVGEKGRNKVSLLLRKSFKKKEQVFQEVGYNNSTSSFDFVLRAFGRCKQRHTHTLINVFYKSVKFDIDNKMGQRQQKQKRTSQKHNKGVIEEENIHIIVYRSIFHAHSQRHLPVRNKDDNSREQSILSSLPMNWLMVSPQLQS